MVPPPVIPGDHSATARVNGEGADAAGSEARPFAASPFGKGAPLASAAVAAGAPARKSAAAAALSLELSTCWLCCELMDVHVVVPPAGIPFPESTALTAAACAGGMDVWANGCP